MNQTLVRKPGPISRLVGRFDGIHKDMAHGWAVDPGQPGTRLRVEIIEGEHVVAVGEADQPHKGLLNKGIGDGQYGFVIRLPRSVFDGQPHVLKARDAATGTLLGGEQVVARTQEAYGEVEGISAAVMFGWVPAHGDDRDPVLEIRVDGQAVGKSVASLPRTDIVQNRLAASAAGFRFDLKPYVRVDGDHEVSVVELASGRAISGTPFRFSDHPCWGVLDSTGGIEIGGWVVMPAPGAKPAVLKIKIDGVLVAKVEASKVRTDLRRIGVQQTRCGFTYVIPPRYYDAKPHRLAVRLRGTPHALRGGVRTFKVDVRYGIDVVTEESVSGWIVNAAEPDSPLHLDVWDDGELVDSIMADHPREDVAKSVLDREAPVKAGFAVKLPSPKPGWTTRTIRLAPYGQSDPITGKDILMMPRHEAVRQAEGIARAEPGLRWLVPDWIAELRRGFGTGDVIFREVTVESETDAAVPVDVIVPVYKGIDETLACIRSVLNTHDRTRFELVVINDASPEPTLTSALRHLAEHAGFTLIENPKNLGFVATVNRGMKLHPGRDVILLNSDTVVPKSDWVSRLRAAAYSEDAVATVTPFSNRATICSLPRNLHDNDMPEGVGVDDVDALCAAANSGVRAGIPTGVGFCMYIKRRALVDAGLFDEVRWARGYGEENDFCIRSASMGWKHVAACDVFVQHHGAISFQAEKAERVRENLAILNHLYPDYPRRVEQYLRDDPLAFPRARVVRGLIKRRASRFMLHVIHKWGGGIEVHVKDLCRRLAAEGEAVLILKPGAHGWFEVATPEGDLVLSYPGEAPVEGIVEDLRFLGVWHVHFHQTIGLGEGVWKIPGLLGVPFDYTLHDFYVGCPRINLLDDSGRFCGQPDLEACESCVASAPLHPEVQAAFETHGGTVAGWREQHGLRLQAARRIFAPSQDTNNRVVRFYPNSRVTLLPHPEESFEIRPASPPGDGELRVALIGAIGLHKGHDMLLRVAKLAKSSKAPVRFIVVGFTCDDRAYDALDNVEILGPYEPEELPGLLENAHCDAALFLSIWPETYSYTLTEAWRAGLVPVTLPLGAQAERVLATGSGTVLAEGASAQDVLRAVLDVRRSTGGKNSPKKIGEDYADLLSSYYGLGATDAVSGRAGGIPKVAGNKRSAARRKAGAK